MTEALIDLGLQAGQRNDGRLMRQPGIQIMPTRKFKVEKDQKMVPGIIFPTTTDGDHTFNIAPNLLQQDFTASGPNHCRVTGGRHHLCLSAGRLDLSFCDT